MVIIWDYGDVIKHCTLAVIVDAQVAFLHVCVRCTAITQS